MGAAAQGHCRLQIQQQGCPPCKPPFPQAAVAEAVPAYLCTPKDSAGLLSPTLLAVGEGSPYSPGAPLRPASLKSRAEV